ncbi:MAG: methionyl-tRNA formyltransferase [bacterium]
MRVALFVADDFSLPLCNYLANENLLACLVTQPDRPRGRGKKIEKLPVREVGDKCGAPVLTPTSLNDENFKAEFEKIEIDIPLVSAYGLYIPKWIRDWQPFPCINVHPSLLPRWRGAAPVRRTLMAGDTKTGVVLHFTERKMDTGDIIMVSGDYEIDINQNHEELRDALSYESVNLVRDFLEKLQNLPVNEIEKTTGHSGQTRIRNSFDCRKQDDNLATLAPKVQKSETVINWELSAMEIHNMIRALSPAPGASTGNSQRPLKILKSEPVGFCGIAALGEIISDTGELVAACGSGAIRLILFKPAGKNAIDAVDFLNGYRVKKGDLISNF